MHLRAERTLDGGHSRGRPGYTIYSIEILLSSAKPLSAFAGTLHLTLCTRRISRRALRL